MSPDMMIRQSDTDMECVDEGQVIML